MDARLDFFLVDLILRRERTTGRREKLYRKDERGREREQTEIGGWEEERPENQAFNEKKSRWEISCDDDSIDTINF